MRRVIFTAYAAETDMTFIMMDTLDADGEVKSTEALGWYYGGPNEEDTEKFIGKLRAEY